MKLIVVDFVQLISLPNSRTNDTGKMDVIMRTLQQLAKRLGVHIVILSQLTKSADLKRPKLNQLLGSGSLEQMIRTGVAVWNDKDSSSQYRDALVCVMKGAQGTGEVECRYDTLRQRFMR